MSGVVTSPSQTTTEPHHRVLPEPLPLVLPPNASVSQGYVSSANRAWATTLQKLLAFVAAPPDEFRLYTTNGKWDLSRDVWTNWCEGFLSGQLWLLALRTGRPDLRELAERLPLAARRPGAGHRPRPRLR